MIRVTVDASKAVAKFRRMERAMITEGDATTLKLARLGQAFSASIAPRDTGLTVQGILVLKNKQMQARIAATNSHPELEARGFNLPYWMHNSRYAKSHIKTGDPKFMFTTRDYLEGIAGPEARKLVARVTNA